MLTLPYPTRMLRFIGGLWGFFFAMAGILSAQTMPINGNLGVVGHINYCLDAGTTNAYACTMDFTLLAVPTTLYGPGRRYTFTANTTNTAPATLSLNGIGARTIKRIAGGILTDLFAGEICTGQNVEVVYDGTNFQMVSEKCNATVIDANFTIRDNADPTKQIQFMAGGITSGQTRLFTWPDVSSTPVVTDFANVWGDGFKQTFNPNGTTAGINVGSHTADPSSLTNGDTWYNSTTNEFKARINGVSVALGAGGGGITGATANGAMYATSATTATSTGALTDGQLLIGRSGNTPLASGLTGSATVTVAPGPGTITLSVPANAPLNLGSSTNLPTAALPLHVRAAAAVSIARMGGF